MERSGRFNTKITIFAVVALSLSWLMALTGPARADVQEWTRRGPFGVSVQTIAVDPATPSRLVVLDFDVSGELFYSHDAAASWARPEPTIHGFVESLVAGPGVFYASTSVGGFLRIWRSADGAVWTEVSHPLGTELEHFKILAVDPRDPLVLYGFLEVLYRSRDGGQTWTVIDNGLEGYDNAIALELDPTEPANLYFAAAEGFGSPDSSAVFRSRDGGDSWERADQGLPRDPEDPGKFRILSLVLDPATPSTLYVLLRQAGLYGSTNGAATWFQLPSAATTGELCLEDTLKIAATDPSTLYVQCDGLIRSRDGGVTWEPLGRFFSDYVIDPVTPTILYGGSALQIIGIERSEDGGDTWQARNDGFDPVLFADVGFDRQGRLWGGTSSDFPHLVAHSSDGGSSWQFTTFFSGRINDLDIDPAGVVYVAVHGRFDGGIYRTADGGESWQRVFGHPLLFPAIVAVDPMEPSYVYATASSQLLRSQDGGQSFSPLLFDNPGSFAVTVAVDPATGDVYVTKPDGRVLRSSDRAESWSDLTIAALPDPIVEQLFFDPWSERIYAVTEGSKLLYLDPADTTWQASRLDPTQLAQRVLTVAFDPTEASILYVGTERGTLVSNDRGDSFRPLERETLGRPRVRTLVFDPSRRHRLVASTGEGLFEIDLLPPTETMTLHGGRFEVEVSWLDFLRQTGTGTVAVVPGTPAVETPLASRDSAVVEFFGGENWELLLKVLDGTSINGHFWVFFGAATNVEFRVTVTDTSCNQAKTYLNPLGLAAPAVTDETAFVPCADPGPPACIADGDTLCVGGGRFAVDVAWADFSGAAGVGRQVFVPEPGYATSNDSGLLYFFSEDNWELLLKVLDGCSINNHFWFFSAATTDVGYSITVTDTLTGAKRTYGNPLGTSAAATTDTQAFATCN